MLIAEHNKTVRSRFSIQNLLSRQAPQVEIKQIEMAFLASTKNLAAGLLAVLVIFSGILNIPSPKENKEILPYAISWAFTLTFFLMRGIYLTKAFMHRTLSDEEKLHFGRRLAANGAIAGFLWGGSS
ncbi:hypothetical protein NX784_20275, partial [Massilia pinisoli]